MDPVGFLEPLFQLLWAGSLGAQQALLLVRRKLGFGWVGWGKRGVSAPPPCQPAPLLAAPSACPHMLCLLIPLIQLECGWG